MLLPEQPFDIIEEHKYLEQNGCYSYDSTKSTAYTRALYKTAALFFDRIYIDMFDYNTLHFHRDERMPIDAIYLNNHITGGIAQYMDLGPRGNRVPDPEEVRIALTQGVLELARQQNLHLTPIYGTIYPGDADDVPEPAARESETQTMELVLSTFPLIDEKTLTWEQVDQFRSDIESIGGVRRVRSLLEDLNSCSTTVAASDLIESRIDEYRVACAKHGASLLSSSLKQIYKKDTLIAAMGTGLVTGDLRLGAMAGGLKLAADVTLNLIESVRDRHGLSTEHPEGAAAMQFRRLNQRMKTANAPDD